MGVPAVMQWVTLRQAREEAAGTIVVKQHWYLTEDKTRVVEEGHPDGRWLWAAPGTPVKLSDALRLGAVQVEQEAPVETKDAETAETPEAETADEPTAEDKPAEPKARKQAANKAKPKAEDK